MNNEQKTKEKLERLNKSIGIKTKQKNIKSKKTKEKPSKHQFKAVEVSILLIITMIVSLAIGSLLTYKLMPKTTDKHLEEFIKNYHYIIKNYNGKIDKKEIIDGALEGMLSKLDKNSTYINSQTTNNFNTILKGSYHGLGVQIYNDKDDNIVINKVFENSPADKAGLKEGDIITKINGKSTLKMPTTTLTKQIKGKTGTIKLTYKRKDKEKTVKVNLGSVNIPSVSTKRYNKNNKKIGYISITIFASNTTPQFKKYLDELEKDNIDSLIIDLRSNSGGYLSTAQSMISEFLNSSHVIYQIQKNKKITKYYSNGKTTKEYPIYILVDRNSASASEIMTSALKEQYKATVIGETTYGKGTVQEMQDLSGGSEYKLTTKNWLTSKGKWIDKKGIEPDISISLNEKYYEDPTEENDNQLQKAIDEASK